MRSKSILVVVLITVLVFGLPKSYANLYFDDGLVHNISSQLLPTEDVYIDYQAPGMGTTVNLLSGGMISGSPVRAYNDSYFNILGGQVNAGGSVYAYNNTQITFSSGAITNGGLFFYDNTEMTFSGGSIFAYLETYGYSTVNISGGQMLDSLMVHDNSNITMSSGSIADSLYAYHSVDVTISGGTIVNDIVTGVDTGDTGVSDAIITLIGSDFAVDGNPVGYGELYSINGGQWDGEPLRHLTGILDSGDLIDNDFKVGYQGKIVLIPEPATLLLLGLGAVMLRRRIK